MTQPGDPPTDMEKRAEALGISFTRGRTWTSNSHLSLEAAEFATEHGDGARFHKAMFKAYFTDLADIGDLDTVVRVGEEAGLPADELRAALTEGRYREAVEQGIEWARQIGVSAVPTFVLGGSVGIVGAHEAPTFARVIEEKLGRQPKT